MPTRACSSVFIIHVQDVVVHGWNSNTEKKKFVSGTSESRGKKQACGRNVVQKECIAVRAGELLAGRSGSGRQGAQHKEGRRIQR